MTVSTVGVPPMSFEFEANSISAAMDFICRAVPMMTSRYDFELWTVPEEPEEPQGIDDLIAMQPVLLGHTKSFTSTRFVKAAGLPSNGNLGHPKVEAA